MGKVRAPSPIIGAIASTVCGPGPRSSEIVLPRFGRYINLSAVDLAVPTRYFSAPLDWPVVAPTPSGIPRGTPY